VFKLLISASFLHAANTAEFGSNLQIQNKIIQKSYKLLCKEWKKYYKTLNDFIKPTM